MTPLPRATMGSEHAEQVALVQWAAWKQGACPALRLLFAVPNGGKRDPVTAARLKVAYCQETGDTKPSHLAPWEELSEWDKEADRRIGAAIAVMMAERLLPTSFAAIATTRLTRREEWPAQRR